MLMKVRWNSQLLRVSLAGAIIATALTGCSTIQSWTGGGSSGNFPPPGAAMANGKPTGPPPEVADCTLTNSGSPNKYVCNGKTYTSFQLSRWRAQYAAQQQSGQ